MYTLIITGYDYYGKAINKVHFYLSRRKAKVIASRYYNPAFKVTCRLSKSLKYYE